MSLLILYATETGTSQDVADRIALCCRRIHLPARISDVADYPPVSLISEQLVIFVVSTTGSGHEPRSMTPLWSLLLRADLPNTLFDESAFAVFGLGDSSYDRFCWPAKQVARRMAALGAREICARGEGDEQHILGVDGALEPWLDTLADALLKMYPLPEGVEVLPADELSPPRARIVDGSGDPDASEAATSRPDVKYHDARVRCNARITAEEWYQDVRHIEFEFDEDIRYDPGDVALIHPTADPLVVESVINTLGWGNMADDRITVDRSCTDQTFPDLPRSTPITLRTLLAQTVDISAIPRRAFFKLLGHFATDDLEKEKLKEFSSAEGADELYDYVQRPRRTIHEVLAEFRSAKIPRDYIFDVFPPLRPRQFSIASFIKQHPRQVHLCVAIVRYRTILRAPRVGVCTSYLATLQPGDSIRIGLQKGLMTLPPNPATPILCVGPGTGIAPMRAVIEARIDAGAKDTTLYFGCRSSEKDQHYAEEWKSYVHCGNLVYRVAFSRDGKKTYVQDVMKEEEEGQKVWRVLSGGGWVFISGSSNKMPEGVKAALAWAARRYGGKNEAKAAEYVRQLENEGRLVEECWS